MIPRVLSNGERLCAEAGSAEEAGELARLVSEIREFALPMLSAIAAGNLFKVLWKPGGPWG